MTRWPRLHLAAATALALLLVAVATSTRQPQPLPTLQARYVDAAGVQLRYVRAGRGPTVVLLHGYGESLIAWRGLFDRLTERADVIALDLPGFGLSGKPASGYATDSMAGRVLAALSSIGIGHAALVGHSLGGAVAAAAAARAPGQITRLVLVDAALVGAPFAATARAGDGDAMAAMRRAIAEYEAIRTRFTAPHDPHWLAESDSAASYLPADDPAYRTALAAVLREFDFGWLTAERATRLRLPILILWGEYDPLFPPAAGRALASTLSARLEVIPRTWHRPHEERPEAVAAALERFLASEGAISATQTP